VTHSVLFNKSNLKLNPIKLSNKFLAAQERKKSIRTAISLLAVNFENIHYNKKRTSI
jgi:hypothetical protein